jgi:hypothetical protein
MNQHSLHTRLSAPLSARSLLQKRFQPEILHLPRKKHQPVTAVIRVYDDAGNVIETHEHAGDFKEP